MQDKRARKTFPPKGTKKYPVFLLGEGVVKNKIIELIFTFPIAINPKNYRFYIYNDEKSKWIEDVNQVRFVY